MAKRNKVVKITKPVLIRVGRHFINPEDVAAVREVKVKVRTMEMPDEDFPEDDMPVHLTRRKTMYIVDMKSNPNPTYAIWIEKEDADSLLDHFEIKD